MAAFELLVIIPVYNEQDSLFRLRSEMDLFLDACTLRAGVLFVDDGSVDESLARIRDICRENGRYGYISLERNMGLSGALKAGITHCDSKWIGYIDADLQTSPSDFLLYIPYLDDFDLVTGHRYLRRDPWVKRLSSVVANSFRRAVLKDGVRDTGCPLKIIKADMARSLPFFKGMHRFIPALVQTMGGRVKEIPVQHFSRQEGVSKYRLSNRLIHPFLDTLAVYWMKKRTIRFGAKEKLIPGNM
jgi:dolichol-phosphate mannosyltransferase